MGGGNNDFEMIDDHPGFNDPNKGVFNEALYYK